MSVRWLKTLVARRLTPVILAPGRQRQEDCREVKDYTVKYQASQGYINKTIFGKHTQTHQKRYLNML